jgi:hypothetical protein
MGSNILIIYYAATAVFLTLDYGFGVNLRATFLESMPGIRMGYYLLLFGCFGLMLWRPQWSTLVGVVESLATLVALTFNMALRSMIIVGGAAYVSYVQGTKALASRLRSER